MKSNVTPLYPNEHVAKSVTSYSSSQSTALPDHIPAYHAEITAKHPRSDYMTSNFQTQGMNFLAKAFGAKRVLEVGVFVGYSMLGWANAVGKEGKVVGLEFSPEYAKDAREACEKAGVGENVEIVVGDALETLANLQVDEPFDLIFIDAQKSGYPAYLRTILERSQPGSTNRLLRPGGIIMADNVLRRGLVADASEHNPWTDQFKRERSEYETDHDLVALREFNAALSSNERLDSWLMPLFDGIGMGRLRD